MWENKDCDHPTGHNHGHPLDRKQTFFCGQPESPQIRALDEGGLVSMSHVRLQNRCIIFHT